MAPAARRAHPRELDDEPAKRSHVVRKREPDADTGADEPAWWLQCQERAEFAVAGLV